MPIAYVGAATAIAGAVSSAVGGSGASSDISAGSAQAQALDQQAQATGLQNYQADRAETAPYVSTGQNALLQYANLEGLNGSDAATNALSQFQASPGYQYQVDQGLRAVDHGAAANGLLRSGQTLKAEQTLGSNLANQDFGQYVGRLNSLATFGLQGAQLDTNSTKNYNDLLTKTTTDETGTITGAAGQQASIYNTATNNATGALTSGVKNGLYEYSLTGTNTAAGGNPFNGAGGSLPVDSPWGG